MAIRQTMHRVVFIQSNATIFAITSQVYAQDGAALVVKKQNHEFWPFKCSLNETVFTEEKLYVKYLVNMLCAPYILSNGICIIGHLCFFCCVASNPYIGIPYIHILCKLIQNRVQEYFNSNNIDTTTIKQHIEQIYSVCTHKIINI